MFGNCPDDFAASDSNRQLACRRRVPHFRAVTLLHAQKDCLTTADSCSELCANPVSSLPHHARHLPPAPAVPPTTDYTIPMGKNDRPLIRVKYDVRSITPHTAPSQWNRSSLSSRRGTASRHLTLEYLPSSPRSNCRQNQQRSDTRERNCHRTFAMTRVTYPRRSCTWMQHYFETRTWLLMSEAIRDSLAAHE